jgi:D-beta-D-heptose 7-phosphate kinase/D-beta-D-heptose 1-phosphate adenosyltransferase
VKFWRIWQARRRQPTGQALPCNAPNWRDAGQKIAFANGCFDLLHPGAYPSFKEAAHNADKLVVRLEWRYLCKAFKGRLDAQRNQPSCGAPFWLHCPLSMP